MGEINNKQDSIFDLSGKLIKPDRIYKKGIWELQIIYIQKGTRSEGLHGVLIKNDKVLNQKEDNKMIKTDIGVMKYYGKFENRKHNWDISGWCFSDANKIPRPSTKINRNK